MAAATLMELDATPANPSSPTKPTNPMSPQSKSRAADRATARSAATSARGYDRLVLTGFMGSGKSTVGAMLAERLGWSFVDLDHEIERRAGASVPALFSQHGEAHFRRLESAALASVLGLHRTVIALGGGVPEELGNRLQLEQSPRTAVVYLEAPFEELLDRCLRQPGATERPNLANPDLARQRFQRRQRHYERIALHRLPTSGRTAEETLDDLLQLLEATPPAR